MATNPDEQIIMRKEVSIPMISQFKTYFSEPFFCIMLSKAKLLVLNLRQGLAEMQKKKEDQKNVKNVGKNAISTEWL